MATVRIYYKRFVEGESRPVICARTDNWHVADVTVRKDGLSGRFNPNSEKNINLAKESVIRDSGCKSTRFHDVYTDGENTITWHFRRSAVPEYEVAFN